MGRSLEIYLQKRFELAFVHHFSLTELENLPVWEFDLLYDQVVQALQNQADAQRGFALS